VFLSLRLIRRCSLPIFFLAVANVTGQQYLAAPAPSQPWRNAALPPEQRARLALAAMTLDEKLQLVHGTGWGVLREGAPVAERHNGGAGFVPGIPRLGIPDINLADSAVGIRMAARESRYATLLPSVLGLAATWDPDAGFLYGSVIGRELRDQGYDMSIGGGVDLMREPRNGRNFEYAGEDPLRAQRPGDGPQHAERRAQPARDARDRSARVPDCRRNRTSTGRDVLL
jgi:beta-glucosidase